MIIHHAMSGGSTFGMPGWFDGSIPRAFSHYDLQMQNYYTGGNIMADTNGPETEWVTETDKSAVNLGDLIRITDGQEVHIFHLDNVSWGEEGWVFRSATHSFRRKFGDSFEVNRPVVVLPTSAGSVIRWRDEFGGDHLLVLDDSGNWGSWGYEVPASKIKKFKVVSRPGFEVAEEVLKAVHRERARSCTFRESLEAVAERYGVDL